MLPDNEGLTRRLLNREESAFEQVFKAYYKTLHAYAYSLLKDEALADEMVQQVFFKLWERHNTIAVRGSLAAYLYRAVHNESLNHLKHIKVREKHQMHVVHNSRDLMESAPRGVQLREMEARIRTALAELPEQCRTIFQMSRFEDLRYREIADKLQISVKTVEHQMGKALRVLRERLADFLILILLLIKILK